ncbi:MAG: PDDEXK nuclease domain-containing protein [Bacteroidales bacterium]|nr:PDDEXK nuclease domain-containing protein [Bacteroidales bacterium]
MSSLPNNYLQVINELKERIRSSQLRAQLSLNKELILLYWNIGKKIIEEQENQGWGSKVIDRISHDLKQEFPDFTGFSVRNLKYMRAFADAYPTLNEQIKFSDNFVQQAVAQITGNDKESLIVQQLVAQTPWGHQIQILTKLKEKGQRLFYMAKTIQNGWSRDELIFNIENKLHLRQGNIITNFDQTLSTQQSKLAAHTFKSPYVFGLLNVSENMKELEVEKALINHLKSFLLELGSGFAYLGNQKKLTVEGDDFFPDLLFYHIHLRCYVIFELKIGNFKPEYAGKLNFYINTVDMQLRSVNDNPSIGILLCKTPNKTVVKYSLQNIKQAMGVAEYYLSELPNDIKKSLPSEKDLIEEINKEFKQLNKK